MFERRNIKRIYLKAKRDIKDFLLKEKSREFFVFLLFFVVASGFWLIQTLNNDYETEFTIPVRLKGVPDNVMITSEPPSEVRIRVRDKGTVLLNYMLGKSFYPVNLDFADYQGKGNVVQVYASQFGKKVSGQLNASTSLLSMKPDTLEYIYATGASKRLPVRLQGTVGAGLQYYLPDTILTPDSVQAYAPEGVLDTITAIYTRPVSEENITDTLVRRVALQYKKGVKLVPAEVELMLPVDVYTEKTVEVPLEGIDFPVGTTLRTFPSKVQVTFQVGMSRFRKVNAEDFDILLSYYDLLRAGTGKYTVRLTNLPKGVSNVRINPAQVDFLIEQLTSEYGY